MDSTCRGLTGPLAALTPGASSLSASPRRTRRRSPEWTGSGEGGASGASAPSPAGAASEAPRGSARTRSQAGPASTAPETESGTTAAGKPWVHSGVDYITCYLPTGMSHVTLGSAPSGPSTRGSSSARNMTGTTSTWWESCPTSSGCQSTPEVSYF